MLAPKKVKYRKKQKGRMSGQPLSGTTCFLRGVRTDGPGSRMDYCTGRSRPVVVAMTRHVKRGGKIWIRVFPDKPITKKPAETRMGKGKGRSGRVGGSGQTREDYVRDGRRSRGSGPGGFPACSQKAAYQDPLRDA